MTVYRSEPYFSPSREAAREQQRRIAVADLLRRRRRENVTVDLSAPAHPPTFLQVAKQFGFDVAAQQVNRWMEDGSAGHWSARGGDSRG